MPLKKPIKIGKYEVVGLLGKGGMGVVYKANDPLLGRSVAIKMMTTLDYVDNPDLLQRFYREAQSTGNLHHRNIVTVYELGDHEGSPYLVMEYLEGETLDALLQSNRPLPLLDQINFIIEVCDGLSYAHQRSVVHRDIKPGNIMVLKDNSVKIVDFGIAHIGNRTVTRTGQLLGSLPYMSPEQISGKQVDARTDIFSLGVVFYQLLTTHLPFEGETPAASLLKIMHESPRPLQEYGSFPPELEEILLHALAKNRDDRYPAAQDFAFDLVQIRGRIQQEIVDEHLNEAELLISREELIKAREKLSEVLKIDRHNTRAVELSRATQQRIQQQEVGEQVRQLRGQAEDAYQKEQFVLALDLIQKAISLHATDPDLHRLRTDVQDAKTKTERLQHAMSRAESAYQQGELDAAKQAIDEALSVAPDDVHVKSLYRMIQKDWDQRLQRMHALSLIEEARREITSRNFTMAMEVLRKAEAIDPNTPQLRALIEAAQAAREQERRRKALENIKREIEGELDRDEFHAAFTRAESALKEFPEDRGLQKLKDLAEKQRLFAERKQFIEEQVSRSRKLMETGKTEQVLDVLQAARDKVGSDTQLDSLMAVVRETLERERADAKKAEFLRRAKDFLRLKKYAEAIQTLQAAQSELASSPEIEDVLQFTFEQQSADTRRRIADAAAEKAQAFVTDGDYEKAVEVLEGALQQAPDEELRLILVQARHAAADHRKLLEEVLANTESMLQGQRPVEALRYLQSQPQTLARDPRIATLLDKARKEADRQQHVEQALEKARGYTAREEFDSARAAIEEVTRTHGATPELSKQLTEIEERETQVISDSLEKALTESRGLMGEGKADQAIERLSSMGTIVGKVSPKLNNEYQALQQEAASSQARKYKFDIDQLLGQGAHTEAAALLQRALKQFSQNRELQQSSKTLEQAVQRRADAEKLLESARRSFQKKAWREGGDFCLRAGPLAMRDPVVRPRLLSSLESAAFAALNQEWRHAEYLLDCMSQLQPNFARPEAIQQKIASAKNEEAIRQVLDQANGFKAQGDFERASQTLVAGLAQYPREARLLDLQAKLRQTQKEKEEQAVRARARSERETYVAETQRRLGLESTPNGRIQILEGSLRKYPDEKVLIEGLASARDLERKVGSLADEARKLEKSQQYDQAIQGWSRIAELGVSHPDADAALSRLRGLREQARTAAKLESLRAIQASLNSYDLETATSLLTDAQRQFPNDPQVADVAAARDKAAKRRQESLALLDKARAEFKTQGWQQASDLIARSLSGADADPAIKSAAFGTSLHGVRSALTSSLQGAELLLDRASKIQADSPEVATLRGALERQAREEIVKTRLADVKAAAQAGDTDRALSEVNSACSSFPEEPRFLALKQEIERSIEAQREAQEKQAHLLELLEAAQDLRAGGDLPGSLTKINEGLQAFPNHSQFLDMKRAVEKSVRDLEKQKQREEKQRAVEAEDQKKVERQQQKKREQEERRRLAAESSAQAGAERAAAPAKPGKALNVYLAIGAVTVALIGAGTWMAIHRTTTSPQTALSTVAVQINTIPGGATVRNKESGESCVTPNCALTLALGAHTFQVELGGYQPLTTSISVSADTASPITLTMVPVPPPTDNAKSAAAKPQVAGLDLRDAQPGAEVVVDKKPIGRVSSQGTFSADVAPGSHQIQLLTRNRDGIPLQREFSAGSRIGLAGTEFAAPKASQPTQPSQPVELTNSEQSEWQKIKDSQDISTVDGFLKRHPNGAFTPQAQSKLESLYWAKALGSGSAVGYDQYLEQFPDGKYSQQARSEMTDLEWRGLENSTDAGALQNFIKKYPSGSDHDKALGRLDDLAWQKTDQNDLTSLRLYVGNFADGRHAADARKKMDDLNRVASTKTANEVKTTQSPQNDNKAVLDILSQYQKAYETENIQELQKIWPGMTAVGVKSLGDFFRQATNLSMQYQVAQVEISGDAATVRFNQTLKYVVAGKSGKNSAKIVMQLNRLQGGAWQINSIR